MESLIHYFNQFQILPLAAQQAVLEGCTMIKISKNNDLQPIGHTCRTIYFMKKGIARIYYNKNGIDVTESFAFENNIIARVESLFTEKPSRKAIQIIENAEIIGINATHLFQLYDTHPKVERLFRKIFESAYVETIQRIEGIQFYTAEERYQTLLKETPDILKRIPLKYIASYLGITQVTLSRIRSGKIK
jgi:CRP-like cAMP-binding protein